MRLPLNIIRAVYRSALPYILIICFVLFFVGGPGYQSSRHFKAFWNLGHILYFSLLPYWIFSHLKKRANSFWAQALLTIVLCIVLGTVVELLQYGSQRTPDMGDVFRDVIGGLVGIVFLLPSRKHLQKKRLAILQVFTVCLVALQIYPLVTALSDEYIARDEFPVLSNFETPWELQRWSSNADCTIVDNVHRGGKYAMRVQLNTNIYSTVNLFYFHENWQGAKRFQFSICNPSSKILSITCRIHDQKHDQGQQRYEDRFNRRYKLTPGWQTINIDMSDIEKAPLGRKMDLRHIKGVSFFTTRLHRPRVIYIDDVGLVY